jgi:hypothetical protein
MTIAENHIKFSVVIRNRNKPKQISRLLKVLTEIYSDCVDDIIVIDNKSNQETLSIYSNYIESVRIKRLDEFSYGRALNLGMSFCKNKYVLVMSSHCLPLGTHFFKQISELLLSTTQEVAGIRLTMSAKFFDYSRYLRFKFNSQDESNFFSYSDNGILASGAIVNSSVWNIVKFDENVMAFEDKIWSKEVIDLGFKILPSDSFYYYDTIHKTIKSSVKTYFIENLERRRITKSSFLFTKHIRDIFVNNPKWILKLYVLSISKFFCDIAILFNIIKTKKRD